MKNNKNINLLLALPGLIISTYAEYRRNAITGKMDAIYWIVNAIGAILAVFFVYRYLKARAEEQKQAAAKEGKEFKEKSVFDLISNALIIVAFIIAAITFLIQFLVKKTADPEEAEEAFRLIQPYLR